LEPLWDLLSTSILFTQFLDQCRYLNNVTPSTVEWYVTAYNAHETLELPLTKSGLQPFVVSVRQCGVKPVSCNTYIKALNAFCLWLHEQGPGISATAFGACTCFRRRSRCRRFAASPPPEVGDVFSG
jgi:hypothetical protein